MLDVPLTPFIKQLEGGTDDNMHDATAAETKHSLSSSISFIILSYLPPCYQRRLSD